MGIPTLSAALAKVEFEGALSGAVWTVAQLACGGRATQDQMADENVVAALMRVGYLHDVADGPLSEGVARAIGALANNNRRNQELMRPLGAMELLIGMLQVFPDNPLVHSLANPAKVFFAMGALWGRLNGIRFHAVWQRYGDCRVRGSKHRGVVLEQSCKSSAARGARRFASHHPASHGGSSQTVVERCCPRVGGCCWRQSAEQGGRHVNTHATLPGRSKQ